jgi:hypothetical protein
MSTQARCRLCKSSYTVRGMTRHLQACLPDHQERLEAGAGPSRTAYLITARAAGVLSNDYRLDLVVDGQAPFSALDTVLRSTWMECCGHMSAFWQDRPFGTEIDDNQAVASFVNEGDDIAYTYDFGTTSDAQLQVQSGIQLAMPAAAVQLVARNNPPAVPCDRCDAAAATQLCSSCLYGHDAFAFCADCAERHVDGACPEGVDEYMMMPVLNSPRIGLCGYTGPSREPDRLESASAS